MKLDARQIPAFLRDPGPCLVVLLHGDDPGLVHERAQGLVRAVAGSVDDPFLVTELGRGEAALLADAAAQLPLTGGRPVVRVREAADAVAEAVREALARRGPALVVLEAGALAASSKLRKLAESDKLAASIACYPEEGRALEASIRAVLSECGVTVQPEAMAWLAARLGANRAATRAELEKLALFAGAGQVVTLDMALQCVGDLAGLSLDDAIDAALAGDVALSDRALALAIAEGGTAVGILRALGMRVQRLYAARLAMDAERIPAEMAAKSMRPPVFFRQMPGFVRALGRFAAAELGRMAEWVAEVERACKRTGAPAETLARNAVLTIARRGRARGR